MADEKSKTKIWPQLLTTFIVNFVCISGGFCLCWPAPVFEPLLNGETPIDKKLSIDELSWIGSVLAIGACFGAIIAGKLAALFGKKNTLLFAALPFSVAFLVIATTKSDIQLYFCRISMGLGVGIAFAIFPIYTAEISETKIRGLTTSTLQLFLCIGFMVAYSVGPYVSFPVFAIVGIIIPTLFFILFMLFPESPYTLVATDRRDEAIKAIRFLRGLKKEDEKLAVKEVDEITEYLSQTSGKKGKITDLCKGKANQKAIMITVCLVFFQQMSGVNAICIYVTKIFAASKMNLDSSLQTIIFGAVQIAGASMTPLIIERLGRKMILLLTGAGMAFCESLIGIYFVLMDKKYNVDSITFIPIAGMMGYMVCFCVGFGPVPYTIVGEIFADDVRGLGATITAAFAWFVGFTQMLSFSYMESLMGFGGILLMYCAFDVAAVIFVLFVVKETKGKSLQEIQEMLEK